MLTLFRTTTLALLASLLSVLPAVAQGGGEDSAEDLPEYYTYTAPGWSLGIVLSDTGTLQEGGAGPDGQNFDWIWKSNEDSLIYPVYQIDGLTVGRDEDYPDGIHLDDGQFDEFYASLLESVSQDPSVTIYESNPDYRGSDGRRWQYFHADEYQDGGTPDDESDDLWLTYYAFLTLDDGILRQVNFYYLPLGEEDDWLTALDVFLAVDPDFEGDSFE